MSVFGGKIAGLRLERIRASSRYREGVFHNTLPAVPGLKKGTAIPTVEPLRVEHVVPWWRDVTAAKNDAALDPSENATDEAAVDKAAVDWPFD